MEPLSSPSSPSQDIKPPLPHPFAAAPLNPLLLDIVLIPILEYLPTKHLIKCRLTCHHWASLATNILLRRRDLIISLENCSRIQEFTALMQNSALVAFPCLKVSCLSLHNAPEDNHFTNLLKVLGKWVKVLVLEDSVDHTHSASYLLYLLHSLCPSLQVLDFDEISPQLAYPTTDALAQVLKSECPTTDPPPVAPSLLKIIFPAQELPFSQEYWTAVFRLTVHLREINLNDRIQTVPLLLALENSGRLPHLNKLRLEYISLVEIEALLKSRTKLQEFKINTISQNVHSSKMEALLHQFSPVLRVLALGSPENDGKLHLKLPNCKELRELGLFHCDDAVIFIPNFCEGLPKLQKLSVSSPYKKLPWKEYFCCREQQQIHPVTSVTSLTLGLVVADQACCTFLGQKFPNLEKLELEFPKRDFLARVWTTWINLKELYIYFEDSSGSRDISLCGFPRGWLTRAKKWLKTVPDFIEGAFDPSHAFPMGVANLKCLQRLIIEEPPLTDTLHPLGFTLLSDISVYFCLAQMKELRVLKIGRSQITTTAIKHLCNSLPMISSVDIRDSTGPGIFSEEEKAELISYIDYYNALQAQD